MFCKNCGSLVNDGETFCTNCGSVMDERPKANNNSAEIKTTAILVFSIIELICVSPIFGLIALILYFVQLRPAINAGDIEEAKKSKKLIKIFLWIGLILNVGAILLVMLIAIPNFSGIQGRMETRMDMTNAAQIGRATSIWYYEAVLSGEYEYKNVENSFVKLDEVDGLDMYVDTYMVPDTYSENGAYYVTIVGEEHNNPKAVVAIGPENLYSARGDYGLSDTFYGDIDENVEVTYTGGTSGIAYVE